MHNAVLWCNRLGPTLSAWGMAGNARGLVHALPTRRQSCMGNHQQGVPNTGYPHGAWYMARSAHGFWCMEHYPRGASLMGSC